ncbi:MAG TPA: helix-turn-helix domain-containing protein [Candidatus Sulfotelmatobacter sp.]|nr:helix-turn-helix domain-containing protein [Candidatus Sulfotelmatobacter sp.]
MLRPAEPAKNLKQFVRKYVHLEVPAASSPRFWSIPARSTTCIEFTFGNPYRIHHVDGSRLEITYPATLIGAKTHRRIQLELSGRVETFAILFEPTGLQRLFSLPGTEIVNEHYEADMVLGSAMARLRSRLGEAKSFQERVQVADAFLGVLIPYASTEHAVDDAVREIILKGGCVQISGLASQLGIGLRQFQRRFRDVLGISPKRYARIVRFEAAISRKTASPFINWTQIAHELEYHDQMHMIRDFQLLSGQSPSSLTPQFELLVATVAEA